MSTTVKLHTGTLNVSARQLSAGSMARAIDDAMRILVPLTAGEDSLGRQKLALAIAHGVITYLNDHEAAFVVDVPNIGGPTVERAGRVDVVIDPWTS
jgi:hypothetical protein